MPGGTPLGAGKALPVQLVEEALVDLVDLGMMGRDQLHHGVEDELQAQGRREALGIQTIALQVEVKGIRVTIARTSATAASTRSAAPPGAPTWRSSTRSSISRI